MPGGLTGTDVYEYDASSLKNIPCLALPYLALPHLALPCSTVCELLPSPSALTSFTVGREVSRLCGGHYVHRKM